MIQILLTTVTLITVSKAQYGEVGPPAPAPPVNYAPNPKEIPYTSEPPYDSRQVIQGGCQPTLATQTIHLPEHVTCGLPVNVQTTSVSIPAVTQSTIRQTTRQPFTRSKASRSTRLPTPSTIRTQPSTTRRPIQSARERLGCAPSDTLFVVDSTSSVKQFFEEHRAYIIKVINLILPEFDNETRIGIIEYSSPLRRRVKLPFVAHKNRTEIVEIVRKLPFFAGITATGAALKLALELMQNRRPNVPTNVVVLTDGFSYDLVDEPSSMLHRLSNVRTFAATVTDSFREFELETIAGERSRVFKGIDSAQDLAKALGSCGNGSRRRGSQRGNLLK